MKKGISSGGVSLGFGFNVSTGVIIAVALAGIAGVMFAHKTSKPYRQTHQAMSYAAQAYEADTNTDNIHNQIISDLHANATNPLQISSNMDRISECTKSYSPNINALKHERATGQVDRNVFQSKLREIEKQIVQDLGLSIEPGLQLVDGTSDFLVQGFENAQDMRDRWGGGTPYGMNVNGRLPDFLPE